MLARLVASSRFLRVRSADPTRRRRPSRTWRRRRPVALVARRRRRRRRRLRAVLLLRRRRLQRLLLLLRTILAVLAVPRPEPEEPPRRRKRQRPTAKAARPSPNNTLLPHQWQRRMRRPSHADRPRTPRHCKRNTAQPNHPPAATTRVRHRSTRPTRLRSMLGFRYIGPRSCAQSHFRAQACAGKFLEKIQSRAPCSSLRALQLVHVHACHACQGNL